MKARIPWEQKPATVTTQTFKRIKDYVLTLKESSDRSDSDYQAASVAQAVGED